MANAVREYIHPLSAACRKHASDPVSEARLLHHLVAMAEGSFRPAVSPANAVESTLAPTKTCSTVRGLLSRSFVAGPAAGRWGPAGGRGECRRDYIENLPSNAGAASAAVVPAFLVPPADHVS